MGLITKEVEVGVNGKNIKQYEDKGYKFERYYNEHNRKMLVKKGSKIIVKIEDLSDSSRVFVDVKCDGCGNILEGIRWSDYTKQVKHDGTYYCQRCANAGFKHWTSFYDWCYDNLSKDEADIILKRWDYNKNKCTPKDISYASQGINRKGYWFKCLEHSEHESEQKRISAFTGGQKGSINCDMCNTISITHSYLVNLLVDKEDAYRHSFGSWKKILVKCPDCGYEKGIAVTNLVNTGIGCNQCGDGVSFPEKVMVNVLEQLHELFKIQLSKTTFKWCNNYRYDLYINGINGICEIMGNQHYEETGKWGSLKEIQDNDEAKEKLAKENGIINYIILDSRYSNINFIKNSIFNSDLPKLLDFKEIDIDWVECEKFACKNLVKVVCDLWTSGIQDMKKIIEELGIKLSISAIRNYLKKGAKLGWCNYDPKEAKQTKIICLTTREIFDSITEASKGGLASIRPNISACCKGKHKSAGKSEIGEPLIWMYYDEYIKNKI